MSHVGVSPGPARDRGQAIEKRPNVGCLGMVQFFEDRQRLPPGLPGGRRTAEGTAGLAQVQERLGPVTGPNPLSSKGYTLDPWYTWGISYYAENMQSSLGDHGAIIKQRYFRPRPSVRSGRSPSTRRTGTS